MLLCFETIHVGCSIWSCFQERLLTQICCISVPVSLPKGCQIDPLLWERDEATTVLQSSSGIFLFQVPSNSSFGSAEHGNITIALSHSTCLPQEQ